MVHEFKSVPVYPIPEDSSPLVKLREEIVVTPYSLEHLLCYKIDQRLILSCSAMPDEAKTLNAIINRPQGLELIFPWLELVGDCYVHSSRGGYSDPQSVSHRFLDWAFPPSGLQQH